MAKSLTDVLPGQPGAEPAVAPVKIVPVEPVPVLRFDLAEMDVHWEGSTKTLWSYMTPNGRPSFTRSMLRDLKSWQAEIRRAFSPDDDFLDYVVLGSRYPGVFNLGGDLEYVAENVESGNGSALTAYGDSCVDILYENMNGLGLPIITIALIQGDAVGGGFESALSFDVVVAERGSRFAFPETSFGMFPGVGAHSFLIRRIGSAMAERIMLSGQYYSAEEMYDIGLVHVLAEPGEGEQAVRTYISQTEKRRTGQRGIYSASKAIQPVTLSELRTVVRIWSETALQLSPQHVRLMRRLAASQNKLRSATA